MGDAAGDEGWRSRREASGSVMHVAHCAACHRYRFVNKRLSEPSSSCVGCQGSCPSPYWPCFASSFSSTRVFFFFNFHICAPSFPESSDRVQGHPTERNSTGGASACMGKVETRRSEAGRTEYGRQGGRGEPARPRLRLAVSCVTTVTAKEWQLQRPNHNTRVHRA